MSLSAKDLKAINWYTKEHQLVPQLSTPPLMHFKNKITKENVSANLSTIHSEYSEWNEEDKKQRARDRKRAETERLNKLKRRRW